MRQGGTGHAARPARCGQPLRADRFADV